jgi:hypothetical protein
MVCECTLCRLDSLLIETSLKRTYAGFMLHSHMKSPAHLPAVTRSREATSLRAPTLRSPTLHSALLRITNRCGICATRRLLVVAERAQHGHLAAQLLGLGGRHGARQDLVQAGLLLSQVLHALYRRD